MWKRVVATVVVLVAVLGNSPSAQASLWSGTCALTLTFNFSSPVRSPDALNLTVSTPSYSISVAPFTDLNPLTGAWEACAISLSGLDPFRETWVSAGGSSTVWTCEATDAGGTWNQSWYPSPPSVFGSHVITGGPDGWTMLVHNSPSLTFVGSIELTVHPDDALQLARCEVSGMTSLRLMGVMVFQDP